MPSVKNKIATKISSQKPIIIKKNTIAPKKSGGATKAGVKKKIATKAKKTTRIASRPTANELKSAVKKVMKQYSVAIKNLARR